MFNFFKKKDKPKIDELKPDELKLDLSNVLCMIAYRDIPNLSRYEINTNPITINNHESAPNTAFAKPRELDEVKLRIVVTRSMSFNDIEILFNEEFNKVIKLFLGYSKIKYNIIPFGDNFIGELIVIGKLKETE